MVGQAILNVFLLIVGFFVMVKGADWLVDGASGIAAKLKVSSLIIGLTVVALGTSAPEAAVSTVSSITGSSGTSIGNIIGSNIMNVLLILGISSLITNIPVEKSSRCIEIPFLIAISALFIALGLIGETFVWWEGLILLLLYFAFMGYTIIVAMRQKSVLIEEATATTFADAAPVEESGSQPVGGVKGFFAALSAKYREMMDKTWFLIVVTLVGLGCVVGGGIAVQQSASFIATDLLHIDEVIVGLTVVAFGTSLPELVTSISAAKKGDMGIATGNIIGSNIANILFVGGLSFICSGNTGVYIGNPLSFIIDCAVSVVGVLALLLFSLGKKHSLGRAAGVTMLSLLAVYYVYLFLSAYGVIVLPTV
ncbi:MAG: calcium/sodium antiporter [Candidatus Coproplasma sp.]